MKQRKKKKTKVHFSSSFSFAISFLRFVAVANKGCDTRAYMLRGEYKKKDDEIQQRYLLVDFLSSQ